MDHLDEITLGMVRRREGTAAELAQAVRHLEACSSCLEAWRTFRLDGALHAEPWSFDWRELLARWQAEEARADEESAVEGAEEPPRHLQLPRRA